MTNIQMRRMMTMRLTSTFPTLPVLTWLPATLIASEKEISEVLQNELDKFKRIKLIFDEIKFPDYSITRMMKVEFIEFEE